MFIAGGNRTIKSKILPSLHNQTQSKVIGHRYVGKPSPTYVLIDTIRLHNGE